jgi:hypothetical protein
MVILEPHLLLLLVGLLLVGEELHTWLWCHSLHHDHRDGLVCQSVLQCRCGGDGDSRRHHVAPSGAGGFGPPPYTQNGASLTGGILEGGLQRWQSTVHHSYKNGTLVTLLRRKSQATKLVGGELQATKMNGFAGSEANTGRVVVIANEGEFR